MWLKCILRGIVFPPTLGGTVWERRVPADVNKWSNRTEELSSLFPPPHISATHILLWILSSNSVQYDDLISSVQCINEQPKKLRTVNSFKLFIIY